MYVLHLSFLPHIKLQPPTEWCSSCALCHCPGFLVRDEPSTQIECGCIVVQLEESERKIEKLEADKRGLVEEKQTLDTKLRRGSEAIKKVSKEQEKLESKLQKLSSDRDGAVSESKAAKAKVACLEV